MIVNMDYWSSSAMVSFITRQSEIDISVYSHFLDAKASPEPVGWQADTSCKVSSQAVLIQKYFLKMRLLRFSRQIP